MGRLRFGCHDFLNSQPIIYPLTSGILKAPFEIILDSPANLADMLRGGKLDLAFIPAVEFSEIPGLSIVKGFSIAAHGMVETVIMHTKKEMRDIRRISLDPRSRTSVALLKLLMRGYYKHEAEFVKQADASKTPISVDAALVIGDDAFSVSRKDNMVYDLSEEWLKFTGKPFVFSVLCVAKGIKADTAVEVLRKSKETGIKMTNEICRTSKANQQAAYDVCKDYLEKRIRYNLASDDLEGLKLFYKLAHEHGVIGKEPDITFYES